MLSASRIQPTPASAKARVAVSWMRRHKLWTTAGALVLVGLLGNALPDTSTKTPASQDVQTVTAPAPSPEMPSDSTSPSSVAVTPLPTRAPVASRVPVAAAVVGAAVLHGVPEPNRRLTPGSLLATSTKARVCTPGYTRTVRSVTTATREAVFRSYGIAYPPPAGAYELDHLIPLELGGGNAASNLWPETYRGAGSASIKDRLENHLHGLVCSAQVALTTAQQAIAGDWYTAQARYGTIAVHSMVTRVYEPTPTRTSSSTSTATTPGNGATAQCNDGTFSSAAHHQGACSRHGGVRQFYR